jgi:tRNA (cytidine/uridine-2'-O-)-methyltransferase
MISLALYQPDIPGNVGSAMRLCAGLGVPLHIIDPCGFPWDERKIRTAAMDYRDKVDLARHVSWDRFRQDIPHPRRILLMTTKSDTPYYNCVFQPGDILLAGRESAGVPDAVHDAADLRLNIPMAPQIRSLNVINACAMVLGEALRQNNLHHRLF